MVTALRFSNKNYFRVSVIVLFFSISHISRVLQMIKIPREATYGVFFIICSLYLILNILKTTVIDIIYYLLVGSYTLYGFVRYNEYIKSGTASVAVVLSFLPSYIIIRLFLREEFFERSLALSGLLSAFFLLVYYLFEVRTVNTYSMSYGYWISFPICILFSHFYNNKKFIYFIIVSIMYATLILKGSRGAIFLTTLCILYLYYTNASASTSQKGKVVKAVIVYLISVLVLFVSLNYETIVTVLGEFTSNRNIRLFVEGRLFKSPSRESIYNICKSLIDNNPFGYGPLASRMLIKDHSYPHSLWYELQLDCGKCVGIIMFLSIIIMATYNLVFYKNTQMNALVSYVSIIGIGSLMFSSSFYYEMYIPATVALCINAIDMKKRVSKTRILD